jgi:phosphatidylinositol alpha-1,6-mannosyltransferase
MTSRPKLAQKICVGGVTFEAGHGGIARVARLTARTLIGAGFDTRLICLVEPARRLPRDLEFQACHGSKVLFGARVREALIGRGQAIYDSVGLARAQPRLWPRRPFALWLHGFEAWEGLREDHAKVIRRADAVFFASNYTLQRYQSNHGVLGTARVCWPATEQDRLPVNCATFQHPPMVLIVSRLDAAEGGKGHTELLRCWPEVTTAVPKARLVIVGGGTGLERIRALAKASSASSNIDVLGFVPDEDLPQLFELAHVFAMPSRQEGFGIVYVEAMRYGLPVIASVHDGGQEVNVDGVTGYNVDLDRQNELAERIVYLLQNSEHALALGRAGVERWQRYFSFHSFARRFLGHWGEYQSAYKLKGDGRQ